MIPILYANNETDFSHNGIGFLRDTISCEVTEERNGVYEIIFEYPIDGQHFSKIEEECIVKAKPNETSDLQLFRLYKSSKPIDGIVTWSGEHISYELNGNPVPEFEIKSGTAGIAVQKALDKAVFEHRFTGWSDIETLNSTTVLEPSSVRAIFGGVDGSILDTWGGEYEFDNYVVKLHANRGKDTDIVIEYGKNLTDIKQEKNIAAVYTAIFPWAKYTEDKDGETTEHIITLPEKIIATPTADLYSHSKALIMDFTEEFAEGEIITEAALRQKAISYMVSNPIDVPNINITASFVQLWQTPEYKNIAPLERVCLCDTVTVRFTKLGICATAKVIKTVYDVINERYKVVELGNAKSNFADTLNKQKNDIANVINKIKNSSTKAAESLREAVKNATNLITGNSGGYVVLHPAEKPQEILILDKPKIEEAVKVWRWNSSGLGYSKNGYNGEFALAMTMDGVIVADFISAGVLNGALLKADSVSASAISVGFKQKITDDINKSAETLTQDFKAADLEVYSVISKTFEHYSTTEQIDSAISQSAESIRLSVSETYATKDDLGNYSTAEEVKTTISQTSSSIMTEVNKKVNNVDFGTKITQNYSSVQIAWNNISKYIEFSGGAMNIYQSTAQGSNNLLMKLNYTGAWYYYSGTTIGKVGTNSWTNDDSFRGLVFDLEYEADYMCWAHKTSASASQYTAQMIYYANSKKANQGLHFACNTYAWNNLYINNNIRTINYSSGAGGLYSSTHEVGLYGYTAKVSGGCVFECQRSKFVFYNSSSLLVEMYNNMDMHNYNILNQSDARFKTNIQPSGVDALDLINQIDLKEFDWIENGEHEDIGIIAQQLQNVLPDLVDENAETGRLSIKMMKFIPYLLKAIQQLNGHSPNVTKWKDIPIKEKRDFIKKNKIQSPKEKEIKFKKVKVPIRKRKR